MNRTLSLYNTASRQKEPFSTTRDEVAVYCCGPTVYNIAHVGNLRTYIFEDVLKRVLWALGYKVNHVMNITDVGHLTSDADSGDDKMEKGAAREGKTVWQIAQQYTDKFMENMRDLNISEPTRWCKATDHIPEMIALVKQLEDNGITYRTEDGIYFDTSKFPAYCDFARIDPEALRAGTRIDMGDKRNPTDFALWKFSPKDSKRQMEWESPWGVGFPGWHIECSAMSLKYLPQPLDIHCGGSDHVRVHHTNEIAQVEAATHKPFVRYWLHGEFLVLDKGKMAKSGGNFVTVDSVKEQNIAPLGYRLFCYSAHYRSPLSFSWEGLEASAASLVKLRKLIAAECDISGVTDSAPAIVAQCESNAALSSFLDALCDDMNVPKAMGILWESLRDSSLDRASKIDLARVADAVLALDLFAVPKPEAGVQLTTKSGAPISIRSSRPIDAQLQSDIVSLVNDRIDSKKAKDFQKADAIRNDLKSRGIEIKDMPGGAVECLVG